MTTTSQAKEGGHTSGAGQPAESDEVNKRLGGPNGEHSNTTFLGKTIPRRTFLAGATAIGAGAVVASHVGLASAATSKPVVRALSASDSTLPNQIRVKEQVYGNMCSVNSWQGCYLESHVRDGRLVKTSVNPLPDTRYNRICLRGLSHTEWVYNPARVKYPMQRVGPRGSGKWRRISWDEATSTIANSIADITRRYGAKAFGIALGTGNAGVVAQYAPTVLANVLGATSIALGADVAFPLGAYQIGLPSTWLGGSSPLDMSNAELLIMWGNNLTEAMLQEWHFVADALDKGASLIVIDPNYSITASKATQWIPLRPGSDPALGLSLMNVIINENLYDKAFINSHTTLPFLVREDTGMFLRGSDGITIQAWDQSVGHAVAADEATSPALTGTYVVGGITTHPAFQLLTDRVANWSPEEAKAFTDVEPEVVRALARKYATTRKSFIFPGMGVDRWWNGDMTGRALATLISLTGNVGQPGAGIGIGGGSASMSLVEPSDLYQPGGASAPSISAWSWYDAIATGKTNILVPLDEKDPTKGLAKDPVEVDWLAKGVWFTQSNAVSNNQQSKRFIELLKDESKLEFVVVSDSMPTDTVRYADIVLPATFWFENDDLCTSTTHPYLLRNERAIEPPFESKSDYAAFGLVASKLGIGNYFTQSEREFADTIVTATTASFGAAGDSLLKTFMNTGVVNFVPSDYVAFTDLSFPTPTGRMEPYSERVVVNNPNPFEGFISVNQGVDPMPMWQPPAEAWPDNPLHKKYPLVYMQEHSRWRVHTTYFDYPWLREMNPEPYVDISSQDARKRGIQQGDYVEIFNDHGKTVAVAHVSGKMRPGMVSLPKGWQRFQTKDDTGYSDPTNNWVNQLTMNGSFFDNLVEVRKVEV